jgi:hypothetical protein
MSLKNFSVRSVDTFVVRNWILRKHYAKRMPSISYCFELLNENNLTVGVCSFGRPAAHSLIKNAINGLYQNNFLELNRLITNDDLPKNATSFFVSKCLNMLPKPNVIVSYADSSQNHNGYIYQATNWIYTGLSVKFNDYMVKGLEHLHSQTIMDLVGRKDKNNSISKVQKLKLKYGENNVYMIERPQKHRYFYFLGTKNDKKNMFKNLKYKIQPYPKGQNKNYDASYQPTIQTKLF